MTRLIRLNSMMWGWGRCSSLPRCFAKNYMSIGSGKQIMIGRACRRIISVCGSEARDPTVQYLVVDSLFCWHHSYSLLRRNYIGKAHLSDESTIFSRRVRLLYVRLTYTGLWAASLMFNQSNQSISFNQLANLLYLHVLKRRRKRKRVQVERGVRLPVL